MYEIEEKKLSTLQEHIDLSLKLMKRTSNSETDADSIPPVRQIDVAEINSRVGLDQTVAPNILALGNSNKQSSMPLHMTRVAKKMLAVQVSDIFASIGIEYSLF